MLSIEKVYEFAYSGKNQRYEASVRMNSTTNALA